MFCTAQKLKQKRPMDEEEEEDKEEERQDYGQENDRYLRTESNTKRMKAISTRFTKENQLAHEQKSSPGFSLRNSLMTHHAKNQASIYNTSHYHLSEELSDERYAEQQDSQQTNSNSMVSNRHNNQESRPSQVHQEKTEDGIAFEISNKRKLMVRRWKAAILIDIREYYDANGVSKPGKKGISLSTDQWISLMGLRSSIEQAIEQVQADEVDNSLYHDKRVPVDEERAIAFSLSAKRRVTIRFFRTGVLIDLREYYEQGGSMKPGKKGISLSKEQWRKLERMQNEITDAMGQV